ncbi:MAG: TonB-dependent receptor [Paludibacteraceae bacterium]|nr:TonB-dependent receptor [Paludibacteraceae bacterium]
MKRNWNILIFSLLFICLFWAVPVNGQQAAGAKHDVYGRVVSQSDGKAIEMSTVRLFQYAGTDSLLVTGAQTDDEGYYLLNGVADGSYKLIVSSVGYKEVVVAVTVRGKDTELEPLRLAEDVQALAELDVRGHAAEMTVKGDTIEYNTSAYKTNEGDVVEDLLKKMSGVEVSQDGTVKVNGETVTSIRIDGKKFFGDDVQAATKNIPADMIEKIQVIDDKSDMAKLTGFEDDETQRIINLTLKQDKKRGLFGNFNGGVGADMVADNGQWFGYNPRFMSEDFRYNAGLFLNMLLDDSQTTIMGGGNNTNEARSGRGRSTLSNGDNGITWAENLGVNTNIVGKNGWLYGGDAQMGHSYTDMRTLSETEQWGEEYRYFRRDTSAQTSNMWDVRGQVETEWQIDSMNKLILQPEVTYSNTVSDSYKDYNYRRDADTLTRGEQLNTSRSQSVGAKLKVIYNHKFRKAGRTLTLNANVNFTSSDSHSHNFAQNDFVSTSSREVINQWTDKRNQGVTYGFRLSYVEPIWRTNHFLETAVQFSHNNRLSKKDQYNDSLRTDRDEEYSNSLTNNYISEIIEANYKWVEKLFDLTVGVRINPSQTLSETMYGDGSVLLRSNNVWNFSPNASFKYKMGKKNFVRLRYRGTSTQPSIDQIEPVRDNSNSMNETVGNLNLLPEFKHNIRLMYSKFDANSFSSMMAGLQGNVTKDALVSNNIYDEHGKLYQQTVNASGTPWNVQGDFMYNTPFAKKLMQFNTRTIVSYNQRVSYLQREQSAASIAQMISDDTWMLGQESRTGSLHVEEDLTLRLTHDIVDVGVVGKFNYTRTTNTLSQQTASNVIRWSVTGDLSFHLPRNWDISTDVGYTDRIGYGESLGNLSEVVWNASVSKTWTNASLSLNLHDLLNQSLAITQTISENSIKYQANNSLGSYFLITFTYKLNKMGDLKASGRAARMQEMIENQGSQAPGSGAMPPTPRGGGEPPMGPPPGML